MGYSAKVVLRRPRLKARGQQTDLRNAEGLEQENEGKYAAAHAPGSMLSQWRAAGGRYATTPTSMRIERSQRLAYSWALKLNNWVV
jgi:hypothetical protein